MARASPPWHGHGTDAVTGSRAERRRTMTRFSNRWVGVFAIVGTIGVATIPSHTLAAPGGVIVSDQGDCSVGPTNVNHLAAGQTAYVWLIFNTLTTVRGYTYEITGTNSAFDS